MRPPDLKKLLLEYLKKSTTVATFSTRPEGANAPPQFVRIISTGGEGRHKRVAYSIQLTIDSYAESVGRAAILAAAVDEAMYTLPSSRLPVTAVTGTTPAESPDPDTSSPRYTATYNLTTIIY